MGATRFEIEKFNGSGDFALWRKKMRAILVQQKVAKAIDEPIEFPEDTPKEVVELVLETAYSSIILNLADNVLRQVNEEDTALKVWKKLETLYFTKTLSSKIYLKERFFSYKMDSNISLEANLDDFKKLAIDIANTGEKISGENEAIILLNSLPDSFREVKSAIKYGRESLTLDIVVSALRSRDLAMKSEKNESSSGEGLIARGSC